MSGKKRSVVPREIHANPVSISFPVDGKLLSFKVQFKITSALYTHELGGDIDYDLSADTKLCLQRLLDDKAYSDELAVCLYRVREHARATDKGKYWKLYGAVNLNAVLPDDYYDRTKHLSVEYIQASFYHPGLAAYDAWLQKASPVFMCVASAVRHPRWKPATITLFGDLYKATSRLFFDTGTAWRAIAGLLGAIREMAVKATEEDRATLIEWQLICRHWDVFAPLFPKESVYLQVDKQCDDELQNMEHTFAKMMQSLEPVPLSFSFVYRSSSEVPRELYEVLDSYVLQRENELVSKYIHNADGDGNDLMCIDEAEVKHDDGSGSDEMMADVACHKDGLFDYPFVTAIERFLNDPDKEDAAEFMENNKVWNKERAKFEDGTLLGNLFRKCLVPIRDTMDKIRGQWEQTIVYATVPLHRFCFDKIAKLREYRKKSTGELQCTADKYELQLMQWHIRDELMTALQGVEDILSCIGDGPEAIQRCIDDSVFNFTTGLDIIKEIRQEAAIHSDYGCDFTQEEQERIDWVCKLYTFSR
jgi:hypothetical protein